MEEIFKPKKHKIISFRGRKDKIEKIVRFFPFLFRGKVLDVGCGNSYLKQLITADYIGIDKCGKPDILRDISKGVPFDDGSFDTVVAFDILEHIDNIYFIFDELCRVSRKWIVITLPNIYEWRFRFSFLFGKLMSGKYGLPEAPPSDRHRWIFSLTEARNFVKKRAKKNGFEVFQEVFCYYRYNNILIRTITKICIKLGSKFQNLFSDHYLVILKREISPSSTLKL